MSTTGKKNAEVLWGFACFEFTETPEQGVASYDEIFFTDGSPSRTRTLISSPAHCREEIIERLARLSKDFGTTIEYRDGIGIVNL